MRLPVYLQLALVLSVSALSARQDHGLSQASAASAAFSMEGTDVSVCRQTPPADPDDLDADTVLMSVRGTVEQLLASVPAEDSTALLAALEYQFGEIDHNNDQNYLWTWDEVEMDWVRVCIDHNTYSIRASTMSNPIEVVVTVTFEI